MKKLLTSLLCVVMVVCMMPAMAWADEPSEGDAADATKAIKVEYDGNTYYFAAFGELDKTPVAGSTAEDGTTVPYNGVNQWMIDKTETGKTIEITLQDDITVDTYRNTDTSSARINPYYTPTTNLHIPSGRTVILNMNGHTITGSGQKSTNYAYGIINNYGNLTINGSGTIENQSTYGCAVSVGDSSSNQYAATLSINNVTLKSAESPNATKSATVYAPYGTIDLIDGCSFVNSGQRGAINIGQYGKVTTVKNSEFTEGITTAIYISNALQSAANPMIGTIENCTINCSAYGIYGDGNTFTLANIGTIKDTTITAAGSAVWAVRHIGLIENCTIEVTTGHETAQSATAAKIIQTTLGIGKITGDTSIKGNLAIPVYTDGGTVVIESGTFESGFDTVIYAGNSYTNSLEILGGTYIKGEKVLDGEKDSPVVLAGDSEITYPFGKTLDEWPANEENTFTLDYNADKIQADTAAALEEIAAETNSDNKAALAEQLQENINAISDETMRASAQEQADETVKTVNGTVTITLWDGTTNQEVSVAKGSIPVIADPTKAGYTFGGWYTNEALTTPYTSGTAIEEDLKLYAKWTANSYPSVPTIPTVQKPVIEPNADVTTSLSTDGTTLTIKANDGYEITDVTVNGVSKGVVTTLTGLKTGDKVVITTKKIETPDDNAALIEAVKNTKLIARSAMSTAKGKKAVKVYWYAEDGSDLNFDGYEVFRSLKRYSGFGTTPIFKTANEKYYNTAIKKGNKYYYKVRAYKVIDGEKVYTDWSTKAWRTVK